jgi:hypothetical protein
MRNICCLLIVLITIACSSPDGKSNSGQDTPMADTTRAVAAVVEPVLEEEIADEDTSVLEERYNSYKKSVDESRDTLFEVKMSNRQYEATSEITWYFDKDINAIYFSISWSAEGNEGSTERFVKDGNLMCSNVSENSTYETWCQSTGGIRTNVDDESGDETKTYLDNVYGNAQSIRLQEDLTALSAFLREAELVSDEDNIVTLKIEKTVNYGEEFTESAEMKIHKKVYEALK